MLIIALLVLAPLGAPRLPLGISARAAAGGNIVAENLDGAPYADRMVFSRIQTPDPVKGNSFHDRATLRIRNTGSGALDVTALVVAGPWQLAPANVVPATIAPGAYLDVLVTFVASAIGDRGGLYQGSVSVASDDADEPLLRIELAGFWQSVSEQGQEPDLIELGQLFGFSTSFVYRGQVLDRNGLVTVAGDEVLSPFWQRADAGKPVGVQQLAAFHNQGNVGTIYWHAKGSNTLNSIVAHIGADGQSVLPRRVDGAGLAVASFTPTSQTFGFKVDSEWTDPSKNNQTPDVSAGCPGPCGHHARLWPIRDRSGALVPDTWLLGMDYSGINYDYNDNVYLISNIKPEQAAFDPATTGAAPGSPALQLGFERAYAGTLADANGEGTGFSSTQPNRLDLTPGANSYRPALLDLSSAGSGTLRLTTYGAAGGGSNSNLDNTLVNGLQLRFDATDGLFSVGAKLLGPFTLTAGSQQGGVQWGYNGDNFIKLVVISVSGTPQLELYAEQNGVGAAVGSRVPLVNPAAVGSLELFLIGDPANGTLRAAYRIDHGRPVVMSTGVTLDGTQRARFFAPYANGGLVAHSKDAAAVTIVYDSFGITAGDPTLPADTPPATTVYWSSATPAPLKRQEGMGATAADGKLYLFGGYFGDPGWTPTKRADVYDPATDTWSSLPDLPVALSHAAVVADGRTLYLAGGYPAEADGSGQQFATNNVWAYSIDKKTYTPLPALPAARGAGGLVLVGRTLHFFGGSDSNRVDSASHWTLALDGGTAWDSAAALPAPRNHMGAVLLGGKIYAVGGQTGQDGSAVYRANVYVYDPAGDKWAAAANLPLPRSHNESSTLALNGKIVVIGGQTTGGRAIADVSIYDPATDGWAPMTSLPSARTAGVAGVANGALVYTTGSMATNTYVGSLEPAASPTPTPPATPSPGPGPGARAGRIMVPMVGR